MISTNSNNSSLSISFEALFKKCGIYRFFNHFGFTKRSGAKPLEILLACVSSIFVAPNFYRFFKCRNVGKTCNVSYDAVMRFMKNDRCNWQGIVLKVASFMISFITSSLNPENINCLVADDTMIERPRAKKSELLARQFNHVTMKHCKSYNALSVGWTDGHSFFTVLSYLFSSANKELLIRKAKEADGRYFSGKIRNIAQKSKSDVLISMCKRILNAGIKAQVLLVDSWFYSEALMQAMQELGLSVISLVKRNLVFTLPGDSTEYSQDALRKLLQAKLGHNSPELSCTAYTSAGRLVRLVFVSSYSNDGKYLTIVSSDPSYTPQQIVSLYSRRWSIEMAFRTQKEFLGLNSECQAHNFTTVNSFMNLANLRFILMEFNRRINDDPRSMGEIFFNTSDELHAQPYAQSLSMLINLANSIPDELAKNGCLKEGAYEKAKAIVNKMLTSWYEGIYTFVQNSINIIREQQEIPPLKQG